MADNATGAEDRLSVAGAGARLGTALTKSVCERVGVATSLVCCGSIGLLQNILGTAISSTRQTLY